MKTIITVLIIILLLPSVGFAQAYKELRGIAFSFYVPTVSNLSYYDYELEQERTRAAFGIGMSITYKNKKNKFSFGGGGFVSGEGYIGENLSDTGTGKKFLGEYVDVLYQRNVFKGLSLIAGINFVDYHYSLRNFNDLNKDVKKDDKTIGLTAGIDYTLFGRFGLMVLYRPAVISFNKNKTGI